MRQTPVNDYLEEISTKLPEELYGNLSDAVYETVCDFDEEVAQLKAENAKLRDNIDLALDSKRIAERRVTELLDENAKLRAARDTWQENDAEMRELVRDIYGEYRYLRVRFHRTYVQHEERMRAVEQRMRELGVEEVSV